MRHRIRSFRVMRLGRAWNALRAKSSIALLAYLAWRRIFRWKTKAVCATQATAEPQDMPPQAHPAVARTSGAAIPKIIFQTWKSRTDLPANYRYWSETLRSLNPQYDYVL